MEEKSLKDEVEAHGTQDVTFNQSGASNNQRQQCDVFRIVISVILAFVLAVLCVIIFEIAFLARKINSLSDVSDSPSISFEKEYESHALTNNVISADSADFNIAFPEQKHDLTGLSSEFQVIRGNPSKIVFLKTHKTGSSTITAMFHLYCDNYDKNCLVFTDVVPGNKGAGWKWDFQNARTLGLLKLHGSTKPGDELDLWLNHMVYGEDVFKLVTETHGQLFTIVRQPVSRWRSAVHYYKGNGSRKAEDIHDYAMRLQSRAGDNSQTHLNVNGMCQELGIKVGQEFPYDIRDFSDSFAFEKIRSGDWYMMVLEKLEESLVILTYAYQLPKLPHGAMKSSTKREDSFSEEDAAFIEQVSDCDMQLYDLALKMHDVWKSQIPDFEAKLAEMQSFWKASQNTKMLDNRAWNHIRSKSCYPFDQSHI